MRILYFVHDPMCSWCYAFAQNWQRIRTSLPESISVQYVVGGLAPDSDEPMPAEVQQYVQENWHRIQSVVPGTDFNFDFWTRCRPRRSTYPACRAVLAAKHFGAQHEAEMIEKIQAAYYLEARNPSDTGTLCELAGEIGLDGAAFGEHLKSEQCQAMLESDLDKMRALGVRGFPSLVLETDDGVVPIPHDYIDPLPTLKALDSRLSS